MNKKRKIIDLGDLLDQQPDPSGDMVVAAVKESEKVDVSQMSRLDRIRSSAVIVDEPLFTGETMLDLGKVTIGSEDDTQQISKELLEQKEITENSIKHRNNMIAEMEGNVAEDIVEQFDLDVPIETAERPDRKKEHRANSKAIEEILHDLHNLK